MADNLIHRARFESPLQHRAFLLHFTLDPSPGALPDDPEGRNWSVTSLAVGVGPSQLRDWALAHRWRERAKPAGARSQRTAWEAYRHRYMAEHGDQDVPTLAPHVRRLDLVGQLSAPSTPEAKAVVAEVAKALAADGAHPDSVDSLVRMKAALADEGAIAKRVGAVAERAKSKLDAYTEARKVTLETMTRVSDLALAAMEKSLEAGRIKFKLTDLKALNDLQRDLLSEFYAVEERANAVSTGVIVDSVRVRQAKAAGLPWLLAVAEDLAELAVIVEQLVAMERNGQGYDVEDAIEVG